MGWLMGLEPTTTGITTDILKCRVVKSTPCSTRLFSFVATKSLKKFNEVRKSYVLATLKVSAFDPKRTLKLT